MYFVAFELVGTLSDSLRLFFPPLNVYKDAMKRSLRTVAESVQAQVVGDGAVEVSGIASIALATPATWFLSRTKGSAAPHCNHAPPL